MLYRDACGKPLSFQVYGGILGIRQQARYLGKNAQVCQISSDQNPRFIRPNCPRSCSPKPSLFKGYRGLGLRIINPDKDPCNTVNNESSRVFFVAQMFFLNKYWLAGETSMSTTWQRVNSRWCWLDERFQTKIWQPVPVEILGPQQIWPCIHDKPGYEKISNRLTLNLSYSPPTGFKESWKPPVSPYSKALYKRTFVQAEWALVPMSSDSTWLPGWCLFFFGGWNWVNNLNHL